LGGCFGLDIDGYLLLANFLIIEIGFVILSNYKTSEVPREDSFKFDSKFVEFLFLSNGEI